MYMTLSKLKILKVGAEYNSGESLICLILPEHKSKFMKIDRI